MEGRRLIEGRWVRWDEERARVAYAEGWWTRRTLGDALKRAAEEAPDRVLVVDGETRVDCRTLYRQATTLARAMLERAEPGSVVSFMLPNWHEGCVVYLAASIAGLVANPLVTAYRNAELTFMLADCRSRMIFIPANYRRHDYVAMLDEVCRELRDPPKVVVVRGAAPRFTSYTELVARGQSTAAFDRVDPDSVRMIL